MRRYLEARGLTSREREELLAAEVRADVERAVSEALEAALPGRESLFDDVYATAPWHLVEQREAARRAPPYASVRAGPQEAALRADQEAALRADAEK
jgi:pyruvate dehydrogenase E1 component alpha subunit